MKLRFDPSIRLFGKIYKPIKIDNKIFGSDHYKYYVYSIDGFTIIISISERSPNSVSYFFVKKGGDYKDFIDSKNIIRDGWVDDIGCGFDELTDNLEECISKYTFRKNLDNFLSDPEKISKKFSKNDDESTTLKKFKDMFDEDW